MSQEMGTCCVFPPHPCRRPGRQGRPGDAPETPRRRPVDAPETPRGRPGDAPATPRGRPGNDPGTLRRRPVDAL
jgi:hypothetical protein